MISLGFYEAKFAIIDYYINVICRNRLVITTIVPCVGILVHFKINFVTKRRRNLVGEYIESFTEFVGNYHHLIRFNGHSQILYRN